MNTKLEILEKKLNIANGLIDELNFDDIEVPDSRDDELKDILIDDTPVVVPEICTELSTEVLDSEETKFEVFTLENLKTDFLLIRNNIIKLVNSGQRILDTASLLDVSDMKAQQLQAIASIQQTLGNNLESLVKIYKQIVEIEKLRSKEKKTDSNPANGSTLVNSGTVVNNQIMFNGDTSQLLDFIKQNQNT